MIVIETEEEAPVVVLVRLRIGVAVVTAGVIVGVDAVAGVTVVIDVAVAIVVRAAIGAEVMITRVARRLIRQIEAHATSGVSRKSTIEEEEACCPAIKMRLKMLKTS